MNNYQIIYSISVDSSGYSLAGINYIKALHYNNHNVKLDRTIVSQNLDGYGFGTEEKVLFKNLEDKPIQKPYIRIHHSVPDRFYIDPEAELNIGYTVNETYDIPKRWVYMCNKMDAIFTASNFCKQVFEKNGITVPVYVIPHTLDSSIYDREKVVPLFFKNNRFEHKFLFAGDVTDRKGIFELLEVWDSIPNTHNASLTIKGYYNSFSEKDQTKLKLKLKEHIKSNNRNKIFFYGHCLENSLMKRFIKSFDYLVSPTKGEGFGLLGFESIFLGVPPILTNATGVLEYANEGNSLLINVLGTKKASDELLRVNPDYLNSQFIDIDKEHLRQILMDIIHNKIIFNISDESYNEFIDKFKYETIAKLIVEKINEIQRRN